MRDCSICPPGTGCTAPAERHLVTRASQQIVRWRRDPASPWSRP